MVSRRDFIKTLGVAAASVVVVPTLATHVESAPEVSEPVQSTRVVMGGRIISWDKDYDLVRDEYIHRASITIGNKQYYVTGVGADRVLSQQRRNAMLEVLENTVRQNHGVEFLA